MRRHRSMLAAVALLAVAAVATAQTYPDRPVRLIAPWPPGGSVDTTARYINEQLGKELGQPVIIENRSGATGNIGSEAVARAKPDGYTLLINTITIATAPALFPNLPFDVLKDFAPISLVAEAPHLLIVSNKVPAKNVAELVALMRANPGKLSYSSAGSGSNFHMAGELFKEMSKTYALHVPYRGGGPAMLDTISGQVEFSFPSLTAALPQATAGRVRALAVTSATRSPGGAGRAGDRRNPSGLSLHELAARARARGHAAGDTRPHPPRDRRDDEGAASARALRARGHDPAEHVARGGERVPEGRGRALDEDRPRAGDPGGLSVPGDGAAMTDKSASFTGSIPEHYDAYCGPAIVERWAEDFARRLPAWIDRDVLEVACGTGVLTRRLRDRLAPGVRLVATDLNGAMLEYARVRLGDPPGVEWQTADAVALPFPDGSFGAVVCQLGIMFVPDKAAAMREARRVLAPGGLFAFLVWDTLDSNPHAQASGDAICRAPAERSGRLVRQGAVRLQRRSPDPAAPRRRRLHRHPGRPGRDRDRQPHGTVARDRNRPRHAAGADAGGARALARRGHRHGHRGPRAVGGDNPFRSAGRALVVTARAV